MEDALALDDAGAEDYIFIRLNPCCNGRCTRTVAENKRYSWPKAGLNPCCNGRCTRTTKLFSKEVKYEVS